MYITPDKILEIFEFVERNYDVGKFSHKGINFWPLLRKEIGLQYNLANNTSYSPFSPKMNITWYLKWPLKLFKLGYLKWQLRSYYTKEINDSESVFFIYPDSIFIDIMEGKKYSRYIDPYFEVIAKYSKTGRLTLQEKTNTDYYHPAETINPLMFFKYYDLYSFLFSNVALEQNDVEKIKIVFKEANKLLLSEYKIEPFKESIIKHVYDLVKYKCFFVMLLENKKVKTVFLECFYDEIKMGLTAACKELNIKTVEIQHGGSEDNVYLPYKNHKINYSTLPDYLWCWSKSDEKLIKKHNGEFGLLRPVIGGNMWLKKIKNDEVPFSEQLQNDFKNKSRKYSKTILITLQFPVFLLHLFVEIARANEDFFFVVRQHPLTPVTERKIIIDTFNAISNVDYSIAQNMNLYNLFNYTDIQLTHSSTTCMEALSFNVPTIICNKYGYDFYKEQIEKKVVFYSEDKNEISRMLRAGLTINEVNKEEYLIRCDEEDVFRNLKYFLN